MIRRGSADGIRPAGYVNLFHKVGYRITSVLRRGINDFSLPSAAGPYMTHSIRPFFETSAAGTLAILDSDPGVVYDRAVLWLSTSHTSPSSNRHAISCLSVAKASRYVGSERDGRHRLSGCHQFFRLVKLRPPRDQRRMLCNVSDKVVCSPGVVRWWVPWCSLPPSPLPSAQTVPQLQERPHPARSRLWKGTTGEPLGVRSTGLFALQFRDTFNGDGTGTGSTTLMTETSGPTSTTTTLIYTLDSDCTGTLTVVRSDGSAAHYNIVVVKHATEVDYLGTDSGVVATGTARK